MRLADRGLIVDASLRADRRSHMSVSLARVRGGRILATYRRGTDKMSQDGTCCVSASDDGGRTWTEISDGFRTTWKGVAGEIRAAELTEAADGTLTALLTWIDRTAGGLYSPEDDAIPPSRILAATSRDGGSTWSDHREVDTGGAVHPVLSGAILRSARGWTATFEMQEPDDPGGRSNHTAGALFSSDGFTFGDPAVVARHPDDTLYYYDQRQVGDPDSNRLMAAFWTYDRPGERDIDIHVAAGDRAGRTWETPRPTGIAGQIAAPLNLPDGRLALFYVHRHPPCSMRLIASPDQGATWDGDEELVVYEHPVATDNRTDGAYAELWEDMAVWTFGHPAAARIGDDILLAFYAGSAATDLNVHWAHVRQ